MISLDVTVVVVALPAIQQKFALPLSSLQWIVASYSLVYASLLMFASAAADRYGRKRMFLLGLAIFAASSTSAGPPSARRSATRR